MKKLLATILMFLFPLTVFGAITWDTASFVENEACGAGCNPATATVAHTSTAGTTLATCVVTNQGDTNAPDTNTAKWNGVSMSTAKSTHLGGGNTVTVFYLATTSAVTANFVAASKANSYGVSTSCNTWHGTETTLGNTVFASSTSVTSKTTLITTTQADSLILDGIGMTAVWTANANQTSIVANQNAGSGMSIGSSYKVATSTGSYYMNWSGTNNNVGHILIELKAVPTAVATIEDEGLILFGDW